MNEEVSAVELCFENWQIVKKILCHLSTLELFSAANVTKLFYCLAKEIVARRTPGLCVVPYTFVYKKRQPVLQLVKPNPLRWCNGGILIMFSSRMRFSESSKRAFLDEVSDCHKMRLDATFIYSSKNPTVYWPPQNEVLFVPRFPNVQVNALSLQDPIPQDTRLILYTVGQSKSRGHPRALSGLPESCLVAGGIIIGPTLSLWSPTEGILCDDSSGAQLLCVGGSGVAVYIVLLQGEGTLRSDTQRTWTRDDRFQQRNRSAAIVFECCGRSRPQSMLDSSHFASLYPFTARVKVNTGAEFCRSTLDPMSSRIEELSYCAVYCFICI